jgi:DNA-binding transcriptional MerR regulator
MGILKVIRSALPISINIVAGESKKAMFIFSAHFEPHLAQLSCKASRRVEGSKPGEDGRSQKPEYGSGMKNIVDIMTVNCYFRYMDDRKYTIDELCEITGLTRRTIRYYVQEGLIDPPAGRGRGGFYFDSHLKKLQEIKAYQGQRLRLSDIQKVLQRGANPPLPSPMEIWMKYPVVDGIEIHVLHSLEESKRKRLEEVVRFARSVLRGEDGDE